MKNSSSIKKQTPSTSLYQLTSSHFYSCNNTPLNVIKVTELGKQALANQEYFGNRNYLLNKTANGIRSKKQGIQTQQNSGISYFERMQQFRIKSRKKFTASPLQSPLTHHFSKKTVKAHNIWKANQNNINNTILKQLENRWDQKSSAVNCLKANESYREDANKIINQWNHCRQEEKKRIESRLKNLYESKYKKRQSTRDVKRSFRENNFSPLKQNGNNLGIFNRKLGINQIR